MGSLNQNKYAQLYAVIYWKTMVVMIIHLSLRTALSSNNFLYRHELLMCDNLLCRHWRFDWHHGKCQVSLTHVCSPMIFANCYPSLWQLWQRNCDRNYQGNRMQREIPCDYSIKCVEMKLMSKMHPCFFPRRETDNVTRAGELPPPPPPPPHTHTRTHTMYGHEYSSITG